jgi:hypothetical protein
MTPTPYSNYYYKIHLIFEIGSPLCSSGCLELVIFHTQSPICWDYTNVPPHPAMNVLAWWVLKSLSLSHSSFFLDDLAFEFPMSFKIDLPMFTCKKNQSLLGFCLGLNLLWNVCGDAGHLISVECSYPWTWN